MKQIRVISETQKQEHALRIADSLRINRLDDESALQQRRLLNVDTRTSTNHDDINSLMTRADSLQSEIDYQSSLLDFHTDRISTVLDAATDDAVKINDIDKRLDYILDKISELESNQTFSSNGKSTDTVRRLEQKIDELNERISYLERTNGQSSPPPAPKPKKTNKTETGTISSSPVETKQVQKPLPANLSAEQLYQAGRDYYDQKNPDKALEAFNTFIKKYPNHILISNAYYWVAEISYDHLNFAQAAEQFQKVVSLYPKSQKAPEALLKKALCYVKLNRKKEARVTLVQLIDQYPNYVQNSLVTKLMQKTQ